MLPIAMLGERALVDRLRERVGTVPPHVLIGIGDDAAVLEPERGMLQVVTTDGLVEGVHFRRDWTSLSAIGHKALAVNLSDLAAMGASPRASLLSVALPAGFSLEEFDALADGFVALATAAGAPLVGGNLTRSPGPLLIDVTAIGCVARRRLLRRDGGHRGDEVYVSGTIGGSAAGLAMLSESADRKLLGAAARDCVERHEQPVPRTRCGQIIGRARAASAAIDLSDGLADAVRRLSEACGAGVVLDADAIPLHEGVLEWATPRGIDPLDFALRGGEDYELAFTVPPRLRSRFLGAARRCKGLRMSRIGRLVADPGAWVARGEQLTPLPGGFDHF
ncbi:MAG: thiamine-phosphate kinase [Vicinamibacterales bacterium]